MTSRGDREGKVRRMGLLRSTIKEYAEISVLHGVRYFGEPGRPWVEKVWWLLAIVISVIGISYPILDIWQQWNESPVLLSFADKPTAIWEIPFPTVTICPSNKYRRRLFDAYRTWKNASASLNEKEKNLVQGLLLVCRQMSILQTLRGDDKTYLSDETLQHVLQVAPPLSETAFCARNMDESSCTWMMDTLITPDGLCFTYNALPNGSLYRHRTTQKKPAWSLEEGYRDGSGMMELPVRTTGAGVSRGISLELRINISELDYMCTKRQGFKIILTNPADVPNTRDQYYFVPTSGSTQLAVLPSVTETEESLRSYHPHQRHCYYNSERKLAYFNTYTQENCNLECLTNYTLSVCRCVDFFMPREKSTPLCGLAYAPCMRYAELELQKYLMGDKTNSKDISCDCLPSCKHITYSAEISQTAVELQRIKKVNLSLDDETFRNISINILVIFIKQPEFLALRRRELYGVTSFIANCGGLLGLCCGFSVLSLAEIIYYFTLRMWYNSGKKTRRDSQPSPKNNSVQSQSGWY